MKRNRTSPLNRTRVVPFFHHALYEGTSSQNSILFYELCRRVCELQLTHVDVNAAVLLYIVLCRHARSLYSWRQPFPGRCLHSGKISSSFATVSTYRLCVLVKNGTYCWELLHVYVDCCHVRNKRIRDLLFEFTARLVGIVFSVRIIQ